MNLARKILKIFKGEDSNLRTPVTDLVTYGFGTYGAENLFIHSWDNSTRLVIGNFCSLADNIHIYLGGNHNYNLISTFPFGSANELTGERIGHPRSNGDITIGSDVWIGSHVSIMSGVTVGHGAVLAAFSHVVKDVQPYEIVGGNPAKHIKFRFAEEVIQKLLYIEWWNFKSDKIYELRDSLTSVPSEDILDGLDGHSTDVLNKNM